MMFNVMQKPSPFFGVGSGHVLPHCWEYSLYILNTVNPTNCLVQVFDEDVYYLPSIIA